MTEFTVNDEVVARRSWGGAKVGVRVELEPGAAEVRSLDTKLVGSDGTVETLRSLAAQAGEGRSKRTCE